MIKNNEFKAMQRLARQAEYDIGIYVLNCFESESYYAVNISD
jgi:hypothetical protein